MPHKVDARYFKNYVLGKPNIQLQSHEKKAVPSNFVPIGRTQSKLQFSFVGTIPST